MKSLFPRCLLATFLKPLEPLRWRSQWSILTAGNHVNPTTFVTWAVAIMPRFHASLLS